MDDQKAAFISRIRVDSNTMADLLMTFDELRAVFIDRGYNSGGSNPITDDDLADLDIDAADVALFGTAVQQLINWRDDASVTSGDYGKTLNIIRAL